MTFRGNEGMQRLLSHTRDYLLAPLPQSLVSVIGSGLVEIEQCIVLKSLAEKAHVKLRDFQNCTEYECFVNHVHIKDYVSGDTTAIGIAFLRQVSRLAREGFPKRQFRGIIATDGEDCTVRFHAQREGQHWLDDDLEKYKEAVGVLDS